MKIYLSFKNSNIVTISATYSNPIQFALEDRYVKIMVDFYAWSTTIWDFLDLRIFFWTLVEYYAGVKAAWVSNGQSGISYAA